MAYRPMTEKQNLALESGEIIYVGCLTPGPVCIMQDRDGHEGRGRTPREACEALEVVQLEDLLQGSWSGGNY